MWPPSISPSEVAILLVVAVLGFILAARYSRWLLGIVACFLIAALATPPDPGSTIVAGSLLSLLYVVAVLVSLWMLREKNE